jgi:hypothetical protein
MSALNRTENKPAGAKGRRAFWVLVAITVLATGSLTSALARRPGAWTGLTVAASGVVLLLASALACRVMVALEQRRRRGSAGEMNSPADRAGQGVGSAREIARENRRRQHRGGGAGGERATVGDAADRRSGRSSPAGRG